VRSRQTHIELKMQAVHLMIAFSIAIFLCWLEAVRPDRAVFAYPVLPMDTDPPSYLGPLVKCPPNSEPCADPQKECVRVTADAPVFIGSIAVPPGEWCLPRGKRNCATLTAKQVWTADGWRCDCLYPDIAGGEDCTLPVACDCQGDVDCANKLLTNQGQEYLGVGNAYDQQLACQCASPLLDETLNTADPLRCHQDPCSPVGTPGIFQDGQCRCEKMGNWVKSNVTHKCQKPPDNCIWNHDQQTCQCGTGMFSVWCQSETFKRPDYITKTCPGNGAGAVCENPCRGYCQNNAITHITEVQPGKFECACECIGQGDYCYRGERCQDSCRKRGRIPQGATHLCCNGYYEGCDRYSAATGSCLSKYYACFDRPCPS